MESLRAAAKQVDQEMSFESSQRLLDASEEIAAELGFPSPTKALQERRRRQLETRPAPVGDPEVTPKPPLERESPVERRERKDVGTETEREVVGAPETRVHPDAVLTPRAERKDSPLIAPERGDSKDTSPIRPIPLKYSEPPLSKEVEAERRGVRRAEELRYAREVSRELRPSGDLRKQQYLRMLKSSTLSRGSTSSESSRKLRDEETIPRTKLSKLAKLINRLDQTQRSVDSDSSLKQLFKSSTQEQLCRSMMVISNPNASIEKPSKAASKSTESLRSSVERLSRPKTAELRTRETYALLDDKANCTFRPKTARKGSRLSAEEDSKAYGFLDRQEAMERSRRQQMEFNRGKAEYDAKIDKRVCPQCGAKQSYDEFKEKRKKCPNCRVDYAYRVDWNRIQSRFFSRILEYAAKQEDKKKRLILSILEGYKMKKKVYDSQRGQINVTEIDPFNTTRWTNELETEFFARLEEFVKSKQGSLKQIEKDMYGSCTFKPSTTRRKTDFESDEGYDPFLAFMERYEEDWDRRLTRIREENDKKAAS